MCLLIQCCLLWFYDFSVRYVLKSVHVKKFFDYMQLPSFDVAADATATFKVIFVVFWLPPHRHRASIVNLEILLSSLIVTKMHLASFASLSKAVLSH
mgnify:CR=1 FL=1